jgi:hypothetical protein
MMDFQIRKCNQIDLPLVKNVAGVLTGVTTAVGCVSIRKAEHCSIVNVFVFTVFGLQA